MALVTRFEDLQAWQAARRLAAVAHELTQGRSFRRSRNRADQLRRAAISTATNVAEGFASGSHAEFQRFLRYAIRSAAEVQSCLYLAADQGAIDAAQFGSAYESAERVKSLCSALVRRLAARRRERGPKPGGVADAPADWIVNQPRSTGLAVLQISGPGRQHVSTSTRQHVNTGWGGQ